MTVHVNCWIVALYNNGSCANKDAMQGKAEKYFFYTCMITCLKYVHGIQCALFIDLVHECTTQPVAPAQLLPA